MFAYVPIYTKELTILIKGTVTYRMDYSDHLADEMIAFEGSDLAKKATWSEYSKLEAVASRHHDYQYIHNVDAANRGRKIQAQNKREDEIKQLIINLYEKHDVFAGLSVESPKGKKQYFEGYVKK